VKEYDVIIIGAGHNGLIAANYLAREGLSVAIVERRYEAGGGLCTEELITPGFRHNLHSYYHAMMDHMPAYKELELERYGATYKCPQVQTGLATSDGNALTMYTDLEKTCKSISRFSTKDAETYKKLCEGYRDYMNIIVVPAVYTQPIRPSERMGALEPTKEGIQFLRIDRSSPLDIVNELFECEELKSAILNELVYPRCMLPDYYGLGAVTLLAITMVERKKICIGGSHMLAHALWRSLIAKGGVVLGCRTVKRIIVDDGEAKGVVLASGEEIGAKRAVVSAVDLKQTFIDFIGDEKLDSEFLKKVENFKLDEFSLFSIHLALKEAPRLKASEFNEDINQAFHLMLNVESPKKLMSQMDRIRKEELPDEPILYCSIPTLYDKQQAPEGKHTAVIIAPVPYAIRGDAAKWDVVKEDFMNTCLDSFNKYAPNLKTNIIGKAAFSPLDIERRFLNMRRGAWFMGRPTLDQVEYFRPIPELSDYRTPVKRLYLAGSSCHPGGGITGGPGFIASGIILEDLKKGKI
jgi:phytoene dehydrogenase-like protein